jgi:cyclophilin family peptidyl-prolyl cis-trans isomerase
MMMHRRTAFPLGALCLVALLAGAAAAEEKTTPAAEKAQTPAATETSNKATETPASTDAAKTATAVKETKTMEKASPASAANEIGVIETSMGTVKVKFFADAAPKAVENFKGLARKNYYNGIVFHRVIDNFMIQGGDPTGSGRGGQSLWNAPFEDEFSPKYRFDRKGLLAMANAGPKTNGSQFFITLVPTPWLNDKHTIFGEVIEGMDVIEKIGKVAKGPGDKPVTPITMTKVTIAAPDAKAVAKPAPTK